MEQQQSSTRFDELTVAEGAEVAARWPTPQEGSTCGDRCRAYICTREEGHAGVHVAHGSDGSAFATWVYES